MLKIYEQCCPQSTDRCVSIKGNPEQIGGALKGVIEAANSQDVRGEDWPYDPVNFDPQFASEYGGYGDMAPSFGSGGR